MRSIDDYKWKPIDKWSTVSTYNIDVKLMDGSVMSYRRWLYYGNFNIKYWRIKK